MNRRVTPKEKISKRFLKLFEKDLSKEKFIRAKFNLFTVRVGAVYEYYIHHGVVFDHFNLWIGNLFQKIAQQSLAHFFNLGIRVVQYLKQTI